MDLTIYPNHKFYYFNRDTLELGTISPNLIKQELVNGFINYSLKNPSRLNLLIVQAVNIKRASAKFLTIIHFENDDIRKSRKDS